MNYSLSFAHLPQCRPRTEPIRAVVLHWTAGVGSAKTFYKTLIDSRCSIHYWVDADGAVWSMCPEDLSCVHANAANPWSIGIEVQSPGKYNPVLDRIERARGVVRERYNPCDYSPKWRGKSDLVDFTAEQYDALAKLVPAICSRHDIPYTCPSDDDVLVTPRRLKPREVASVRGVIGHFHAHDSKEDCGPRVFGQLGIKAILL